MLANNKNLELFFLVFILTFCQISGSAQINVNDVYDSNPTESLKEEISNLEQKQNELRSESPLTVPYADKIKLITDQINNALNNPLEACDLQLIDEIKKLGIVFGKFEKQDCSNIPKKRKKNRCIPSEIVSNFDIPFSDIYRKLISLYEKDKNTNNISDSCEGFYISDSCKLPTSKDAIPQSLTLKDQTEIKQIGTFEILSNKSGNDNLYILRNNTFLPLELKILPGERDPKITQSTISLPSNSTTDINNGFSQNIDFFEFINENILVNIPTIIPILPKNQQIAFKECIINPEEDSDFQYNYVFRIGSSDNEHTDDIQYYLPFKTGTSHVVAQGENGTFSHFGFNLYSIDFGMPEGTEITAIRDGTVVAIKEDSDEGGANEEQYADKANYVWVLHEDGSIANYLHLKKDGVLLNLGDNVKAKDVIALSGNTGYSTGPHLHLQLRLPKGFYSNDSIPIRFRGINGALTEGISYTAE